MVKALHTHYTTTTAVTALLVGWWKLPFHNNHSRIRVMVKGLQCELSWLYWDFSSPYVTNTAMWKIYVGSQSQGQEFSMFIAGNIPSWSLIKRQTKNLSSINAVFYFLFENMLVYVLRIIIMKYSYEARYRCVKVWYVLDCTDQICRGIIAYTVDCSKVPARTVCG